MILCLFIILFYTQMEGSKTSFIEQVNENQFNGAMLLVLTGQIIIMILERFIYKSKTFVEKKKAKQSFLQMQNFIAQIE